MSTTGYATGGGWTCSSCGVFVPFNQGHSCVPQSVTNVTYPTGATWSLTNPDMEQIARELKSIRELLEKVLRSQQ